MRALYQRADFPSYRVCRKSHQSRHIYCNKKEWVEAQGYLLGVCLERHGLELYGGCLFFNHDHFDLGHPWEDDALVEPRFSRLWEEFRFLMWRLLKRCQGWHYGPVYSRLKRTHQGPVLDAEEFWRVLCYDTAQAVAAGFFSCSEKFPGLVFLPQDVLEPRVFKRNSLIEELDPGGEEFKAKEVTIQLGVPRIFSHLTREEYAAEFKKRLKAYEKEVGPKRVHPAKKMVKYCRNLPIGTRLGLDDLLEQTRGHEPPPQFTQSFEPVYTSKPELKAKFQTERQEFWDEHDKAFERLQKNKGPVKFPAGTYGWRRRLKLSVEPPSSTAWEDEPLWMPD